jgi:zinc protease
MKKFILLLILLVLPHRVFAQDAEKVFNAQSSMLDNGMQVVVIPNHRAPVVTHMVWYKVGAADEVQGKSGIAHFLEHLMFKGSPVIGGEPLAPGAFSEIIRGMGGEDNAFTSKDYTAFYQSVAVENLETVMRMEAGRMRGLSPPPEHVDSERNVVIEERRMRTDNDPRGAFQETLAATLFPDHPYGIPTIGWPEEIEKLNWADSKAFYDQWYGPNNAVLVVSGDVSGAEVLALAKKTYGTLPSIQVPERTRAARPSATNVQKDNRVEMHHPSIRQPMIQIGFRVPGYTHNAEESLALQVLEEIAGGGPTSRFYKALVFDKKIATNAGLSYDSGVVDDATLWVFATPVPGVTLPEIEKALNDELQRLVKDGVTAAELGDAKARMQAEAVYARDSLSGPAMIFGHALATGESIDDVEYWPQKISTVTAQQIHDVARKYLGPAREDGRKPVTGYLLPEVTPAEAAQPAEEKAE